MSANNWMNSIAAITVFVAGTASVFLLRRYHRQEKLDMTTLKNPVNTRKIVREIDCDIPPGTRLPEKNERK